jgi:hypothetical protein
MEYSPNTQFRKEFKMSNMKIFLFVVVLIAMLLSSALPVIAQGPIPDVYVDLRRSEGNEDGSKERPYNTENEGRAYARSLPTGARLHIIDASGNETIVPVDPVYTGPEGTPLPRFTLYALLAVLALALILVGWQLLRRSRRFERVAQAR